MNTTTAKPTPGPYFLAYDKAEDCPEHEDSGLALIDTGRFSDFPIARLMEWNNARFLHDALTIYHELGLTPRQLAGRLVQANRQLVELITALKRYADHDGWDNGSCARIVLGSIRAKAVPK